MKRSFSFLLIVLLLTLIPTNIVYANNSSIKYEAYGTNTPIFFEGNIINLRFPIVTINGRTYIPLREVAESRGLEVQWNEEQQSINLTKNKAEVEGHVIFEQLFELLIPDSAVCTNYNCATENEEVYFNIKFSLNEIEFQNIKAQVEERYLKDETMNEFVLKEDVLFEWWDLREHADKATLYSRFTAGVYKKTVSSSIILVENQEQDEYYLYAIYR